jgi:thioester reductase-like protein
MSSETEPSTGEARRALLARLLAARVAGEAPTAEERLQGLIAADLRLVDDLVVPAGRPPELPADVLVTGATGFLGAYLVRDLWLRTPARLHCLVRARDVQDGLGRLRATLETYGLWQPEMAERLIAVPGDLAEPAFGLAPATYGELAATVDHVIHNGARVMLSDPYVAMRAANVQGTAAVLRFACTTRPKPVHHVSTLGIFWAGNAPGEVTETTAIDGLVVRGGYACSKYVAERLVWRAGELGLPVAVYRPGVILPDLQASVPNPGDVLMRVLAIAGRNGLLPHVPTTYYGSPVDHVSGAIVHLAFDRRAHGRAFHLCHPASFDYTSLMPPGRGTRVVPVDAWLAAARETAPDVAVGLASVLSEHGHMPPGAIRVACAATLAELDGAPYPCPEPDAKLFGTYLRKLDQLVEA